MTFVIRIRTFSNTWGKPRKLCTFNPSTQRLQEPTYATEDDAWLAVADHYPNIDPDGVEVIRKPNAAREKRIAAMAAVAREHPDWSLRRIEEHLNLRPRCHASIFKRGTPEHTAELADYQERLAAWNLRNSD